MNREQLLFELRAALTSRDAATFHSILRHNHPADVVALLEEAFPGALKEFLLHFPPADRAELFSYLPDVAQDAMVRALNRRELAELFDHMSPDERADVYNRLPRREQEALLPALAHAEREDLRRLSAYEEGTAGGVMTSEYVTLDPELNTRDAIEALRRAAPDAETIYQAFVIDAERRLLGTVSLRELLVAPDEARVGELMRDDVIFTRVEDPREEVAAKIAKYDLIALPVVNGDDQLVGIVTYDDAMDVARAEVTEDFLKAGGFEADSKAGALGGIGANLRDASISLLYRKRIFWLVLLVFGNLFSGAGIAYFEDTITAYVALVFFLPLLIDSGGNAGSQAATLMVRSLATGDVVLRDWGRMFGREFLVALLLGVTMAIAVSALGLFRGGPEIAVVVSLTMVCTVLVGSTLGMSLPFALSRLKLDPATASAPLITSVADAAGVLIYFGIATALLPEIAARAA
jgi:magnesium transporter